MRTIADDRPVVWVLTYSDFGPISPDKRLPEVPDLVQRDFVTGQTSTVWVSDITSVRTAQDWLYLGFL